MVHQAFRKPGSLKRGCYCLSLWSRKGDFHDGTRLSFITGPPPNGWKISIMLEELGVPHKVKYINIGKGEQFTSEFLKIAPNNRMPAIVDPDAPAANRSRCLIPAPSSNISVASSGSSIRRTSAHASRSRNGLFGRSVACAPWPDRRITSAVMRRRRSNTASTAIPMK